MDIEPHLGQAEKDYLLIRKMMDEGAVVRDNIFLFNGAVQISIARSLNSIAYSLEDKTSKAIRHLGLSG